jgi:RimJ/RimL family protein N-acetyltransferase
MILQGKYVTLRPITPDDAAITQKWRTGGRAYLLNKGAQTVDQQRHWIETRPPSEIDWIQVVSTFPVGMIALVDLDMSHLRAEAGHFLIGEPEIVRPFGTKIAAEATALMYAYAFDMLGLHRLYGVLAADNERMLRWNKYLGMREEGRQKDHYYLDGHWQDGVLVGLAEEDYRAITIPRLRALIGE